MKIVDFGGRIALNHTVADTISVTQKIPENIAVSDYDPIIDSFGVDLIEDLYPMGNGRKVIVAPHNIIKNIDILKVIVSNPGDYALCAQYPTIQFAQSVLGRDLEYFYYPPHRDLIANRDIIDVDIEEFLSLGIDTDGWEDIIEQVSRTRSITRSDGGIAVWPVGDNLVDSMSNIQLIEIIKEFDPYIIGPPLDFAGLQDEIQKPVKDYTGIFGDYLSIIDFVLSTDLLVCSDSWIGRFAVDLGKNTITLQGSNDDAKGHVLSEGDRCSNCTKMMRMTIGCDEGICKRVINIQPSKLSEEIRSRL